MLSSVVNSRPSSFVVLRGGILRRLPSPAGSFKYLLAVQISEVCYNFSPTHVEHTFSFLFCDNLTLAATCTDGSFFHFHFITYMTFTLTVTGTDGCLLLFILLQSDMCLPCFFHYRLLLSSLFQGHVVYNDFSYMLHLLEDLPMVQPYVIPAYTLTPSSSDLTI